MIIFHVENCFDSLAAGWEAAGAGLQPGQVVLKVNGNNVNQSDHQEVLEHFSAHHAHQDPPQAVRGNKNALYRLLKSRIYGMSLRFIRQILK